MLVMETKFYTMEIDSIIGYWNLMCQSIYMDIVYLVCLQNYFMKVLFEEVIYMSHHSFCTNQIFFIFIILDMSFTKNTLKLKVIHIYVVMVQASNQNINIQVKPESHWEYMLVIITYINHLSLIKQWKYQEWTF